MTDNDFDYVRRVVRGRELEELPWEQLIKEMDDG